MAQTLPIAFLASRRRNAPALPVAAHLQASTAADANGDYGLAEKQPKWTSDLPVPGFKNSLASDAAVQVSDIGSRLEGARQRVAEENAPREIVVTAPRKTVAGRRREIEEALRDPNVRAFLDTIAMAEGYHGGRTVDYNTLVGFRTFSDYSKHPGYAGASFEGDPQSAAGRYQIQLATYRDVAPKLGITDFSKHSQDMMAVYLMKNKYDGKIYQKLMDGDVRGAFHAAAPTWVSFPRADGSRPRKKQRVVPIEVLEASWAGFRDAQLRLRPTPD